MNKGLRGCGLLKKPSESNDLNVKLLGNNAIEYPFVRSDCQNITIEDLLEYPGIHPRAGPLNFLLYEVEKFDVMVTEEKF